jgi:hypothetical protein
MQSIWSWWNSLEVLSVVSAVLKCAGAVVGIMILVVGFRESTLRGRAQATEKGRWKQELQRARTRAEEAIAKQQPRLLSADQAAIITDTLRSAFQSGKAISPIIVASRLMDAESLEYGRQVRDAIQKSGWTVGHTENSTHTFAGVAIFFNPSAASEQCEIVRTAFTKAGVSFTTDYLDVKRTPIQKDNAVYVIVGNK